MSEISLCSDSVGASATTTFNWEVDPLVTVLNPGDQTNCEGDSVSLAVQAFDAAGNTLIYSASNLPSGLSIDSSTGLIAGEITGAVEGTPYSVTVTATDGSIAASQSFNWSIVPINLVNPGDQENLSGDAVSLQLSGSDSSAGTDTFAYSATGLPAGLSVNASTGLISGTISDGAYGFSPATTVTITYTDQTAETSSNQTFAWYVSSPDASDLALTTAPNQDLPEINLTAAANGSADSSLSANIVGGPNYGSLTQDENGTYTYSPNTGWTGNDGFAFTVTNGDVTSAVATVTVTVAADVPTIGSNLSYTLIPGQSLTLSDLTKNASDPDFAGLTPEIVVGPNHGALSINGDGVYVYTPVSGYWVLTFSPTMLAMEPIRAAPPRFRSMCKASRSSRTPSSFIWAPTEKR